MGEDRGATVLVTGGSGFLGGWCVIELLRRGYAVRTTVRDLSREAEVRATVGSEVDAGDRLTVLAADLTRDEGWPEAVEGCDYVLHVASPFPPKQPKDPDELIVPAREGTLRVLRRRPRRRREADRRHLLGGGDQARRRARRPGRSTRRTGPIPTLRASRRMPARRRSPSRRPGTWSASGARRTASRSSTPAPSSGRCLNDDLSYSLQAVQRLLAGTPGMPRLGFSLVDVRDVADLEIRAMTRARGRRRALHRRHPVPLDGRDRAGPARASRGCGLEGPHSDRSPTSSCGRWRCSTPASARSSAGSASGPSCPRRRPGALSAGPLARSRRRSPRRARA